jgi:hypothetical protein
VQDSICGDTAFVPFFGTYLLKNKFQLLIIFILSSTRITEHNDLNPRNKFYEMSSILLVEDSLMDKVKYVNEGQNADFSRKTLRDLNRNA